jgi:hypothetical protein
MRLAILGFALAALGVTAPGALADGKNVKRTVEMPSPLSGDGYRVEHPKTYYTDPPRAYGYAHPPRTTYRVVRREAAPQVYYSAPSTTTYTTRTYTTGTTYTTGPSCCCSCDGTRTTTTTIAPGSLSGPYNGGVGYGVEGGYYGGGGGVIISEGSGTRGSYVLSAPASRYTFQRRGGYGGGKGMGGAGCH